MSEFLDGFYADIERFFVEHPGDPQRMIEAVPDWDPRADRLAIYGRFVSGHVRRALGKVYPCCQTLVDDAVWTRWLDAYYAQRPSTHHQINQATEGFAAFLAEQPDAPPYLEDLARFEWTKITVYYDAAEIPASVSAPTVNPTLQTIESGWQVVRHWVGRKQEKNPPPEEGAEVGLVWRHPVDRRLRAAPASPPALLALKLALEGIDPQRAAAEAGVELAHITGVLADQARRGLVLVPS